MSVESANEFLVKVAQTDDLRTHCDELSSGKDLTSAAAAIATFGKTNGYDFTADEAISVMNGEMNAASLDQVSGGVGKVGKSSAFSYPGAYRPVVHNRHK